MVDSTNQVQAFHEPPSLRPHCSSSQQWITPELGLSSTPRQGILTRLRLQGKQHLESGRILPRMPSYAHYYQTLIPHMPVPPGSIHLHKHSPSVLTSLSGSWQQARSGTLRARSWCWTLSGRNHFPANSFTWKELLTGLTTYLFQPQSPPSPAERSDTSSA
jgi:hypothetical protein